MDRREITSDHVAQLSAADTSGYWWYAVRQAHVEAALRGLDGPLDLLDLGCGAGGVLDNLRRSLSPRRSYGLDGTQEAVDVARSRGLDAAYADFRQPLELPFAPTAVTCLDVLEHLEILPPALEQFAVDAQLLVVEVQELHPADPVRRPELQQQVLRLTQQPQPIGTRPQGGKRQTPVDPRLGLERMLR